MASSDTVDHLSINPLLNVRGTRVTGDKHSTRVLCISEVFDSHSSQCYISFEIVQRL